MINIGIITVRGPDYHPTRRLAEAARQMGHCITRLHPYQIWPEIRKGRVQLLAPGDLPLPDIVLPRQGADVGDSCLLLIRSLSNMEIRVINGEAAIRISKHKFRTLTTLAENGVPVPDTVFVNSPKGLDAAISRLGGLPLVVKQVSGRQGRGIFLLERAGDIRQIENNLEPREGLLVQRYIPVSGRKDIRAFVIGGRVAAAMELKPPPGDFRANFHLSGQGVSFRLSSRLEELALKAAGVIGLEIAGVDFILDQNGRPFVMEANYAPGFKGLEAATGKDIAGEIISYAVSTYAEQKK